MDRLRTEHLVKRYGKRTVVDDVSIETLWQTNRSGRRVDRVDTG